MFVKSSAKGKYGDGAGLWLHKANKDQGKWVLLVTVHGKRREMGLGTTADVSLKSARETAAHWRSVAKGGKDPIKERERQKRSERRNMNVLNDVAKDAFESRKAELKGDGKAGRWFTPLQLHVLPRLGSVPVSDIDQIDIRDALAPIWHEKASTAEKALQRLAICLRHAAALGLDVDLQATEKARMLLGRQRHSKTKIPALHWKDVPSFYESLNECTSTHLALRMLILTSARSTPVRYMHIDQIDGGVWTIPASAMKGRKGATSDFRVPLSSQALEIVAYAKLNLRDGYLFPSPKRGVISDMTMSRLMERRELKARPHGFRSSFRTWCSECDRTSRDVAETSLAHSVRNKVEDAYDRTDFLDQRRVLMQRWADYVSGETATVVAIHGAAN